MQRRTFSGKSRSPLYNTVQLNKNKRTKELVYIKLPGGLVIVSFLEKNVCHIIEAIIETCAFLNNTATVTCSVQYA